MAAPPFDDFSPTALLHLVAAALTSSFSLSSFSTPPAIAPALQRVQCECSLVPCGQCQDGCSPELCGDHSSKNWCADDNALQAPSFCLYPPDQLSPLP